MGVAMDDPLTTDKTTSFELSVSDAVAISAPQTPDNRFPFTKTRLEEATPSLRARFVYDAGDARSVPGLCLQITPAGCKSFYLYRRINRRPERIKLGRFPDITVEQARIQAKKLLGEIAQGADPITARRALREELTFGELLTHYLAERRNKAGVRLAERSREEYQAIGERDLGHWRIRKLSEIKKADLVRMKAKRQETPYAFNRVLALVRAVFNYAMAEGLTEGPNPALGVRGYAEIRRDRFLQGEEIPRFLAALEAEPNPDMRDFFLLSLLIGARKANLLSMRWEEIDLHAGTWRIPRSKNGQPLVLPLSSKAQAVLADRWSRDTASPWVFPSHGATGHLVEPKGAWSRLLQRAKLENLRIHDLRRSLGSWQAINGASLTVIGKSLGHQSQQSTEIYARLSLDPVRESVERATSAMLNAGNEPAKVIELTKRKGP